MMIFYDYWRSSASYRLRIALGLLKLPYENVAVDLLLGEQTGAANLARNPQGLVPTLQIDGLTLTQSLAILEYLDETRKAGFLPKDPAGRARVRALAYAIAMEIAPICNLSVRKHAAAISGGAITADDWQVHFMAKGLAAFERLLDDPATGQFCHGDHITMADICLLPQVYNARRAGLDLAAHGQICRIVAALEAIPEIAAAYPDKHNPAG